MGRWRKEKKEKEEKKHLQMLQLFRKPKAGSEKAQNRGQCRRNP